MGYIREFLLVAVLGGVSGLGRVDYGYFCWLGGLGWVTDISVGWLGGSVGLGWLRVFLPCCPADRQMGDTRTGVRGSPQLKESPFCCPAEERAGAAAAATSAAAAW